MTKYKILLFIVLATGIMTNPGTLAAQDEPATYNRQVGMHLGSTTGYGFSYRQWYKRVGFQTTAFFGKDDNTFGDAGLTLMYSLKKTDYTHFYWYLSNSFIYMKNKDSFDNTYDEYKFYDIGFGPGFSFGKIIQFNLMFGYGFYDVTDQFYIYPAGEIGLYYCF